ncbi:G-protein coupled receptor 4-like [Myxocyprinus asiaticus]|uniref:G-protein coupled receptor 4-like n=1 Tax=Myxocyprinus asiaticus TaxID=70543 RepID=UPI002223B436|nr:G-protein coupled receptor 4-like [Myxocyprinus asiaticus]
MDMVDTKNILVNFTTTYSSTNLTTSAVWQFGTLEACMFIFSFISGLSTHSYIIWLIIKGTRSKIASEFFNLNLSVCEIILSVNSLFTLSIKWFPNLTTLVQLLFGNGITGRPLFQCLMCVERYLAVVHPVTFLKFKPLRYRVICSTTIWIVNFGSCLFCMFTFLSLTIYIYVWFYLLQFILFFSIQLFCLLAVLRALKQPRPGERGREEENNMKRRAFYIILITTVSMIITYVPHTITGVLVVVTQQSIQVLWSISFICYMLGSFIQTVLYLQHQTRKLSCLCSL